MLNYSILNNKKTLYDNGEEYLDLLNQVFKYGELNNDDLLIVNQYYVARPDLISLAVYGDDRFADIICKYNGISNPFELNENDMIRIPDLNELEKIIVTDIKSSELIEESNEIIRSKKYKLQKEVNETRSPGDSVVGEENYVIDKSLGVIFY